MRLSTIQNLAMSAAGGSVASNGSILAGICLVIASVAISLSLQKVEK